MKKKKEEKKVAIKENYNLYRCPLGGTYYLIKPDSYYFPIFFKSKIFMDTGTYEDMIEIYNKIDKFKFKQLIEYKE